MMVMVVDALNLIHQGAGAEEGDYSNIWSHKSSLGNLAVSYDGVIINSYNISPEIQNGNIVAIGVLAMNLDMPWDYQIYMMGRLFLYRLWKISSDGKRIMGDKW